MSARRLQRLIFGIAGAAARLGWVQTVDDFGDVQQSYRDFAREEVELSACYANWAAAVAEDPEVLELLATLPMSKRQPNLVFAAARWHGSGIGPYDDLRTTVLNCWEEVRATVLARSTQTNEVGRCATLLPLLAGLPQPLALLEVGASAGLCLFPDRYSYRYSDGTALDPADGVSPVVLPCQISGPVPVPQRLPEITWRVGIDLNPLDIADEDAVAWLETLVWPEHTDRRSRLAAAISLTRQNPPLIVAGDLIADVGDIVTTAPPDATLVVFHSAVLSLPSEARPRSLDGDRTKVAGSLDQQRGPERAPDGERHGTVRASPRATVRPRGRRAVRRLGARPRPLPALVLNLLPTAVIRNRIAA